MSVARRLSDSRDAEIRNAVEGYASEAELADAGEKSFAKWFDQTFAGLMAGDDHHFREAQSAAFVSGWLAMARQLGHLPEGDMA